MKTKHMLIVNIIGVVSSALGVIFSIVNEDGILGIINTLLFVLNYRFMSANLDKLEQETKK